MPKGEPAVSLDVRDVSKSYPLFFRRRDRLLALFGFGSQRARKAALRAVSFSAKPGEAIGIIGENGSGKSTLLRIVAGITRPDSGDVYARQPVAAILELGMGFHPDFTGRENAILYGSLLGIPPKEMATRLEDILAFADLGPFANQPLRTYSSGMAARLAFAVATQVDPEVLVVDEALAVGDGAFQKKCVDRMQALKSRGKTILFCSHSLYLVTSFCERAIWLREGRVEAFGDAAEVVEAYSEFLGKKQSVSGAQVQARDKSEAHPAPRPHLRALETEPALEDWTSGEPLTFYLSLQVPQGAPAFHVGVSVDTLDERCVFFASTHWSGLPPLLLAKDDRVSCHVESLPLGYGKFWVNAFVFDDTGLVLWDRIRLPHPLEVKGDRWNPSLLQVPYRWRL